MEQNDRLRMYEVSLHHSRTDRAWRLVVGRSLEQYGLSMMGWLLLGIVNDAPSAGLNMSALARLLEVTMPQVTVLTSNLLEQKLVKQKVDKHDRRNRYVSIAGKGKSLLENMEEVITEAMNIWLQTIPEDQMQIYRQTLRQISELPLTATEEETPETPSGVTKVITLS